MEAVVFNGAQLSLKYEPKYPLPKIIKDDDVIIKVHYAGICGTDLHIIHSTASPYGQPDTGRDAAHVKDYGPAGSDAEGVPKTEAGAGEIHTGEFPARKNHPLPLGHEFSGVITEVGKASMFKVGQKVVVDPNSACHKCESCHSGNYHYCLTAGINSTIGIWQDGGWAEYVRCPETNVFALPDEITTEQGGLCEPYSCVAHGFDRASPLQVGQKILIVGAGIIGNLWVTALHLQGHREVTVSEMNKARLDIVKRLNTGFRLISPDVLAKEDKLYDVIVDCTGVGKVMEINFNYLSPGGKYVLFGCCPPTHQATLNPFQIYNKELTVIGVKINPYTFPKTIGWLKAMGDRYLNYENLGIKTYKLSEYQQALNDLKAGTISKALFKLVK